MSPQNFYELTPSEINDLGQKIMEERNEKIMTKKAELEATMWAVTLGIANLKKRGNKFKLFEDEVKKQGKISHEEKQSELAYLEGLVR